MDKTALLISYLSKFVSARRFNRIVEISKQRTRHVTIVLENLYQSHNISAVLRTAECLGIQDVHIIENNFDYQISEQVALGAQKWLTLHRYNTHPQNTTACLRNLKENGYRILATMPHEEDNMLEEVDIHSKTAFLFGTELEGLTPTAIEMADGFVKIPMYGFTESYNVSVSTALVMSYINRKLRQTTIDYSLPQKELLELQLQWLKNSIREVDKIIARYEK